MSAWNDDAFISMFPEAQAVPAGVRVDPAAHGARWLVDGEVRTSGGPTREVRSRVATRQGTTLSTTLLGHEAQLTADDAKLAVAAAQRAWNDGEGEWPSAHVEARIAAVKRFAAAVEAKADEIATLLMWEIGKPRASSRDEVTRSVDYIRNTIVELERLREADLGVQTGTAGGKHHFARTHRRALGVVLCVAPFNYPVNEFLTTVIPALLMGNVVIAKTPRFGVLANLVLLEAFRDAFPKGVVSLLPGDGRVVIPAVMSATEQDVAGNPTGVVHVLAFIGSEGAANAIMRSHPTPITLHKILGLGAKNAAVVLPDADLDAAAAALVKGSLGFNGQRCTAEKIVFAHRSVFDALAAKMVARVDALVLGMPWEDGVNISPLPEEPKLDWMRALVDDAVGKGAKVLNAGGGRGAFSIMRPAVVGEVKAGMKLFHEEQFGPVVPLAAFDDAEEVVRWQRRSPFGQQAAVWGQPQNARALVRRFTRFVARVNLNDVCQRGPDSFGFSAADKSGFGTLSLKEALLAFSRPVLVQAREQAVLDAFLSRPTT
ncbi:MAG: aldehyde dehydrogenase family protein [Myxococcaceae bacterium]|nr:aldehyde dehydrogenase family protein [Myxococcaceae bacterium]